jgi:type II secretory pathway pseudopilin PulG
VRKSAAFTLIEIVISVFILMLLVLLAVPSVSGVAADRRLRRSLDTFNGMVHEAQQRSMRDHRPYLLVWTDKTIELRREVSVKSEDPAPVNEFRVSRGESLALSLPYALRKEPPAEWIFWPSGSCEPARVTYKGHDGTWTADYSPLTAQAQILYYAAR